MPSHMHSERIDASTRLSQWPQVAAYQFSEMSPACFRDLQSTRQVVGVFRMGNLLPL